MKFPVSVYPVTPSNADGLPIGMQLVGPPDGEALLVAQARAVNDRLKAYSPPVHFW